MKAIGKPVEVDFYEIRGWDTADADGNYLVHCTEDKTFLITPAMTARAPAGTFHYVVVQADGYVYLNPKDVFERKYSPIQPQTRAAS